MTTYAEYLLQRHRNSGVLVDTNLLLLLLIGTYDRTQLGINGFKRVKQYTEEDYAALVLLLQYFRVVVTTPHILTEVSNLASQLPGDRKSECLREFVATFGRFGELNHSSCAAANRPDFPCFGLTDSVIADVASNYLVVTDDLPLWKSLSNAGVEALNFNHVRTVAWSDT
jgi:hypothetical protein